jgi:hypothetical protein
MSRENPSLTLESLKATLTTFLSLAADLPTKINYRLLGTAAALLHGVQLPANDIDLMVRHRADVDSFGATLAQFQCLVAPSWLPDAKQYYGNYNVNGIEIGFSNVEVDSDRDTIETFGPGPWKHYSNLSIGSYSVPTVALELRLHTELHRNRPDRFEPILQYLQEKGCNHDLMDRCIAQDCNLPDDLKNKVHVMLSRAPEWHG